MTTIVLDLDDVTLDFTATWRRLYREWFDHSPAEQKSWDDPMGSPKFATKDEFFAWFNWIKGWDEIGYVPGAPGAIWDLQRSSHSIHFVTARHGPGADAAVRWHRASPFYKTTQLWVNVPHKVGTVVPFARFYVDDKPAVVNAAAKAGKTGIAFDRPWNRGKSVAAGVQRARSWADVKGLISAYTPGPMALVVDGQEGFIEDGEFVAVEQESK